MKATDFCCEFFVWMRLPLIFVRWSFASSRDSGAHRIIPTENHIMRIRKTARTSNLCGAFASMATGAVKLHQHFVGLGSYVRTADQKRKPPSKPRFRPIQMRDNAL